MSDVQQATTALSHIPGVRGAMVVDAQAGVPVTAELANEVPGPAIAAFASALFRRSGQAIRSAGYGALGVVQLEAGDGDVVVIGNDVLLVVVLAEPDAQLGLVRMQAQKVAEDLA
jgi:predicted regulator of Ras-like GTPase activity (Roadblock/LC7/MglB family)